MKKAHGFLHEPLLHNINVTRKTCEIRKKLDENNIAVMPEKAEINALNLSFSGISVDKIDAGIKRICDVIQQEKK